MGRRSLAGPRRSQIIDGLRSAILKHGIAEASVQRIASALTLARVEYQLSMLQMELSELSRLAANTNQSTEEVERQIRTLEAMRGRLRALKEGQDNLIQVLREMDQAASAERAAARGRATVTPPKEPAIDLGGGLLLTK